MTTQPFWPRFNQYACAVEELGMLLDISYMPFDPQFLDEMEPRMQAAFRAMTALEGGAIANPDENRQVGHYWLRAPQLAPTPEIQEAILTCAARMDDFCKKVHAGIMIGQGGVFKNILVIGIGGSALGPQFVSEALGQPGKDCLSPYFFDNTDPDGMDKVLARLKGSLGQTLVVVISKSGGTPETRNGMLEAQAAYKAAGLDFSHHAVAITGEGSHLDAVATREKWIGHFPMWDWVGGRTSELAAVGLLPAMLQGIDTAAMLHGAAVMDTATRVHQTQKNPAALLALMWYWATDGKGRKDMVVLPYKDRLALFSKYLQQLVMESLGKGKDLSGNVVHQGIAVYGNKGSTDQHAYVQQLRDGVNNFFVTFISVLNHRAGASIAVEGAMTSGDFLQGFMLGTRQALYEKGRPSITVVLPAVTAQHVGALIALYERAVGFYGSLIQVNAYHQPGVEAGKQAAAGILKLKQNLIKALRKARGRNFSIDELAQAVDCNDPHMVFYLMEDLCANGLAKDLGGVSTAHKQYTGA